MKMLPSKTLENLKAFSGETLHIRIKGHCMAPMLEDGQKVEVKRARSYRAGDILVFADNRGNLIAHRMLGSFRRAGERRYLTRADNSRNPDASISREQILGKLSQHVSPRQRLHCRTGFVVYAATWLWKRGIRRP
ncbi:S24 family peptidase [Thiolapillus brandeum]|uniref:Peptidase S24/S26A/S26B/S26C domain-containing protein n=1 Tax=Thiolapillus brandeum TaxID=1076588 RepID=A0A7U6JGM2_9GAMM|nr:S24 family peptidase [Thiolapillus brandeum]BAO43704.1 hypothetical protein TBH_C0767 [Thiolapillus brandeum]